MSMPAQRGNDSEDRAPTRRLHPRVYAALIGFVVWLMLAVWSAPA